MKVPRHNSKSLKPYCHMFNQSEAIKLDISIHLMRNEEKKNNSVIFDLRKNTTTNYTTDKMAFTSNDGDCALVACIIGLSAIRFPIAHKQQSHEIRWLTALAFISMFMLPLFSTQTCGGSIILQSANTFEPNAVSGKFASLMNGC